MINENEYWLCRDVLDECYKPGKAFGVIDTLMQRAQVNEETARYALAKYERHLELKQEEKVSAEKAKTALNEIIKKFKPSEYRKYGELISNHVALTADVGSDVADKVFNEYVDKYEKSVNQIFDKISHEFSLSECKKHKEAIASYLMTAFDIDRGTANNFLDEYINKKEHAPEELEKQIQSEKTTQSLTHSDDDGIR